jgi:UDPglucose 6-dehydrogenase
LSRAACAEREARRSAASCPHPTSSRTREEGAFTRARRDASAVYAGAADLAAAVGAEDADARPVGAQLALIEVGVQAIASDRRIGSAFLFPGCGYGGSCFPKDVKAIIKFSADKKYRFRILEAVEQVNERQKLRLLERVDRHFGRRKLAGRTIAVWGLSFKPRTDDMREAPAVPIIRGLLERGATVRAFDPEARQVAKRIFKNEIGYARSAYDALSGAEALLVVTEWNEFREPDFDRMKKLMKAPVIFDGRNLYDPAQIRGLGFTYTSIGRP